MRLRALGVAMLMFGLAGVIAFCGSWWFMFRYSRSASEVAGIQIVCPSHCGGVDGAFLIGAIVSGGIAAFGLALALARVRPPSANPAA